MKSKYGKLKIKGWKAESKIDSWLNKVHTKEVKCSRQGEYLLCEAKTCIQSLRKEIKNVESFYKGWIEDFEFQIKYIKLQNKEVFSDNKKLKEENDKLKDDFSDCVCSNELLENEYNFLKKENDKLRGALLNISFKTPALGGDKKEMKRALLDIDELCRISLDREDEE